MGKARYAVRWATPALRDLLKMTEYIRADNVQAAARFVRQVKMKVSRLAVFPHSGRTVPEFPATGLREVLIGDYRVIYRVVSTGRRVEILTVRHGARLLEGSHRAS
jgi:addiction module RelE/StbE family toxin